MAEGQTAGKSLRGQQCGGAGFRDTAVEAQPADWRDPWAGRWVRVAIQWWETNGRMQGRTFLAWDMTL